MVLPSPFASRLFPITIHKDRRHLREWLIEGLSVKETGFGGEVLPRARVIQRAPKVLVYEVLRDFGTRKSRYVL